MTHWKLILAYDGTPFHGWQIQPGLRTVQGFLSDAIHRTVGERVLPQGSGRTDAGVHALGQVASFALSAPIPPANLHQALNRCLPPSVRILSVERTSPEFHARHSALTKTYEYRIYPIRPSLLKSPSERQARDSICPPIVAPYVWPCPWPLDVGALDTAASQVLGTHDFTSFAASDPDLASRNNLPAELFAIHSKSVRKSRPSGPTRTVSAFSETPALRLATDIRGEGYRVCGMPSSAPLGNVRTILTSAWHVSEDLIIYRVTANGFLHHMVRNLVGTFVQCGAHRLSPNDIPTILAAGDRSAAGPTAPPTGLFLVSVAYGDPASPAATL